MNRKRHDVARGFSSKMKMNLKESLGFKVPALLLPCVFLGLQSGCTTHPAAEKLQYLQGSWEGVLVGAEKGGKITMTITGHSLHFQGLNTNEVYDATFTLPAETNPQQLRATITSAVHTNTVGEVVRAIFKTGDGNLTPARLLASSPGHGCRASLCPGGVRSAGSGNDC
jgi:hypothetical protein